MSGDEWSGRSVLTEIICYTETEQFLLRNTHQLSGVSGGEPRNPARTLLRDAMAAEGSTLSDKLVDIITIIGRKGCVR
jgi:hypothetical protein